jgi:hypothetical protein
MPRNIDTVITELDIFAKDSSDKQPPPFAMVTGWSAAYDVGGGSFPARHSYNNLFYRLYALANLQTIYGGAILWGATIAYEKGAIVISDLGFPFYAKQTSTGVNPDTDTQENWGSLIPGLVNTDFRDSSGLIIATGNSNLISGVRDVVNQVTYALVPTFDTTKQPTYPATSVMLNGNTFIDHGIVGQKNNWEFEFTYDNPNRDALIIATLVQVDSGKQYVSEFQVVRETNTSAKFTAAFTTISDANSIDPLKGYQLYVRIFQNNLNSILLTKATRDSNAAR